eukprot:1394076-Amorphochlora_amoeboformis.AAC.1
MLEIARDRWRSPEIAGDRWRSSHPVLSVLPDIIPRTTQYYAGVTSRHVTSGSFPKIRMRHLNGVDVRV